MYYPDDGDTLELEPGEGAYLAWFGGDFEGDEITYNIYLDQTDASTLIGTTVCKTEFWTDPIDDGTYYWKVIATDKDGTVQGPVWSFVKGEAQDTDDYIRLGVDSIPAGSDDFDIPFHIKRTCPHPEIIENAANGFVITATGDVTYQYVDCYQDAGSSVNWNLGGFLFGNDIDDNPPDSFLVAGMAMPGGGMPIISDEPYFHLILDIGPGEGELCFDSSFIEPAASWYWYDLTCGQGGDPERPLFVDKYGNDDNHPICLTVTGAFNAGKFAPAVDYDAFGSNIYYVNVLDANGDGDIDLATSNCGSSDYTVLDNDGSGVFVMSDSGAVGSCPYSVVAADFNEDNSMDLEFACAWDDLLQRYSNDGSGHFSYSGFMSAGNEPRIICTEDMNGDSHADLIAPNVSDDNVYVWLGNGDGSFQSETVLAAGDAPNCVIAAQLNQLVDNHIDLAVANQHSGQISIYGNDGSGNFSGPFHYSAGSSPRSVCAANINGDNSLDLVVPNYTGSTITILINDGGGSFNTTYTVSVGANPSDVCAADFDGDDDVDLAVANRGNDNVSILLNDGAGNMIWDADYSVGVEPMCIKPADLDGDTDMDLAVANYGSGDVSILINKSPRPSYVCGDANADESVNVTDAVWIINYVFAGGDPPDPLEAGDTNCDSTCNVADAVWIINYVFAGGSAPCDTNGDAVPDC